MTKPVALPHVWTHGAGRHPTRDAECSCGAEMHDITPGKPPGWLGPVQGNYQRLKRFVEGK